MIALSREQWRARAARHRERAGEELADVVWRRDRGLKHPVDDFLFQYYNLRPSQLAAWHPGIGVELEGASELGSRPYHRRSAGSVEFDGAAFLAKRGSTVHTAAALLQASRDAAPRFGCFGMHEWAMVYRLPAGETRHPYLPLRFPPEQLAAIVEDVGCRCTHFDAFRFFTPQARSLNVLQPTRQAQPELDQPGCLHVNMDLYKWAGKLAPAVASELLLDCFRLAREIRHVDMRASAYDLSGWGLEPIAVETAEGRREYVAHQKRFAERARPLRRALLEVCQQLDATIR